MCRNVELKPEAAEYPTFAFMVAGIYKQLHCECSALQGSYGSCKEIEVDAQLQLFKSTFPEYLHVRIKPAPANEDQCDEIPETRFFPIPHMLQRLIRNRTVNYDTK